MSPEARIRELENSLASELKIEIRETVHDIDGRRVRTLEVGEGPAVLFLHPAGFFGSCWLPTVRHLRGARCVLVDQPGHGLSDPWDYRREHPRDVNVRVLSKLLDRLSINTGVLVGNSLGGMCSLWLALDRPSHVEKLVIVGVPAVAFRGVRSDLGLTLAGLPLLGTLFMAMPAPAKINRHFIAHALGSQAMAHGPDQIFEIHRLASKQSAWKRTMSSLMRRLLRGRSARAEMLLSEDELRRLTLPVRMIWGESDIYGGPDLAHNAQRFMANTEVVVRDGGHMPQLDGARRFAEDIARFVGAGLATSSGVGA